MATKISAARLVVYKASWAKQNHYHSGGPRHTTEASMAKLLAGDTAMWVSERAVQVLGGYGYTTDFPAERFFLGRKNNSDIRRNSRSPKDRDQPGDILEDWNRHQGFSNQIHLRQAASDCRSRKLPDFPIQSRWKILVRPRISFQPPITEPNSSLHR